MISPIRSCCPGLLAAHCDAVIDLAPDEWALPRDELRRTVPALDRLFHPDQFNSPFSCQSLTWMPDDRPLAFVPGAARRWVLPVRSLGDD